MVKDLAASPVLDPTHDAPFSPDWDEPVYPSPHLCFTCGGREFFPVPFGDPVCLTCHPLSLPEVIP